MSDFAAYLSRQRKRELKRLYTVNRLYAVSTLNGRALILIFETALSKTDN